MPRSSSFDRGARNMFRAILCAGACTLFIANSPAFAETSEAQIRAIVATEIGTLTKACVPNAEPCGTILPGLSWDTDPDAGTVTIIYRDPGTPFVGGVVRGDAAKRWDSYISGLQYVCDAVAGALRQANWPNVPVYVVGLERPPAHTFGRATPDGDVVFISFGPKLFGPGNPDHICEGRE